MNVFRLICLLLFFSSCQVKQIYDHPDVELLRAREYLQKLEDTDEYHLIDVRTAFEYKKRHLYGAQNIPFTSGKFHERILALDPDKPVFIYCETAHRSPFAARQLNRVGFKKIYDLEKGFKYWRKIGMSFNESPAK